MIYGLIFWVLSSSLYHASDHPGGLSSLEGTWVEVNFRTDTLTFKRIGETDYMVLARGKVDKVHGPKNGSGQYQYRLGNTDVISLHWVLSADSDFKDYYFKQTADKFTIGNFFDTTSHGARLTFEKVE